MTDRNCATEMHLSSRARGVPVSCPGGALTRIWVRTTARSGVLPALIAIWALGSPGVARCQVDWLLKPVSFDGVTTASSQWTASIDFRTGEATSGLAPGLPPPLSWFDPLTDAQRRQILFDSADQQVFVESFRSELERLNLVRAATLVSRDAATADVRITVRFEEAELAFGFNYRLQVDMTIEGDPGTAQHWRYVAGATVRTPLSTGVVRAKSSAASKLLRDMIPDVEAWIRENAPGDSAAGTGPGRQP